jgi:hypothetical protein
LVTHDVSGNGESVHKEILHQTQAYVEPKCGWKKLEKEQRPSYLCVSNREFEQFLEVFVAFLLLISLFSPLRDKFAMEDENMEESVEEEDDIVLDRNTVQQDGLRGSVEGV